MRDARYRLGYIRYIVRIAYVCLYVGLFEGVCWGEV